MKMPVLGAVLVGALFFTTAIAGEPAVPTADSTQAPQADSAKAAADDKVCTVEKSLGSNMKKRVCRTRAQYEAERVDARGAMDRMKHRSEQMGDGF